MGFADLQEHSYEEVPLVVAASAGHSLRRNTVRVHVFLPRSTYLR